MSEVESISDSQTKAEEEFFRREERMLTDFAEVAGFNFKRGDGWAINPETGEATYDPSFFRERGYSETQSLFGSAHEVEHVRQLMELLSKKGGADYWQETKERRKGKRRLGILDNCISDVADNRRVLALLPSLQDETEKLYQEKLWPSPDLTSSPKHLQLAYAILREGMLPDEPAVVDGQVREAINRLRAIEGASGKTRDVIKMVTNPRTDHLSRLKLVERFIEPEFEALFERDLGEEDPGAKSKEGRGSGDSGESSFSAHYDEYGEKNPQPISGEDIEKAIEERKQSMDSEADREQSGYEEEHGITRQEIADYKKEFQKIEPHIQPLREIFYRIVEERIIPIKSLTKLSEEGVMLEPGLAVQAQIDLNSGMEAPQVMKDFEGQEIKENIPGKFRIRLIGDLSGSMGGEKLEVQRRTVQLLLESLKEFSDLVSKKRSALSVDLDIQSEVLTFGTGGATRVIKPLSGQLTEQQRIETFKALSKTSGTTNDFDALQIVEDEIKAEAAENSQHLSDLKKDKVREIVIVFSDGASDNARAVQKRLEVLREMGVKVVGVGITRGAESIKTTYAPEGLVCEDVSKLPKTLQELLADQLSSLSFTSLPLGVLARARKG